MPACVFLSNTARDLFEDGGFVIIKKYALALLFILFLAVSIYYADNLTLETVKTNKVWLSRFIQDHYSFSVILFFLACVVFVNSPVPAAAAIKVLGGYCFGFYLGAIYNVGATILACLVGFAISRYALKGWFEKSYYDRIKNIDTELEHNGFYYFLSLRLVMVVPYFIINITAGISRVSFRQYCLSTILGVLPTSLIYANGGEKLERIASFNQLLEPPVIAAIVLVAVVSLVPVLLKLYWRN